MSEIEPGGEEKEQISKATEFYQTELSTRMEGSKQSAQELSEKLRQTPEELARESASEGQPHSALDFLELTDLPQEEKNEIFALAFEKASERSRSLADKEKEGGHSDMAMYSDRNAKNYEYRAKILRGEK